MQTNLKLYTFYNVLLVIVSWGCFYNYYHKVAVHAEFIDINDIYTLPSSFAYLSLHIHLHSALCLLLSLFRNTFKVIP